MGSGAGLRSFFYLRVLVLEPIHIGSVPVLALKVPIKFLKDNFSVCFRQTRSLKIQNNGNQTLLMTEYV